MWNKTKPFLPTYIPLFILLFMKSINSFGFLDLPEIKVEKWIENSEYEMEEPFRDWNTDFSDIPQDAVTIIDRGSTIIVSQHIHGLGFICNASYPVFWVFDQAEHADEEVYNVLMKTARESTDVSNPHADRFIAILELFGDNPTTTGNYTCKSLGNHIAMEKSVFIFWDGSSPPYLIFKTSPLVLSGRTVHVHANDDNKTVTLPCHVAQPEIEVQLYQEINGTFQPISEGSGVKYDPKTGFTLNLNKSTHSYGRYKCDTEVEDDEVNIIVERGPRPKRKFAEILSAGTGVFFDQEKSEVVCCARKGQPPPSLHNIFCINPSICKMKEHKLYRAGNNGKKIVNGSCISEKYYMRDFGIMRCKGDGIDIFRTVYTDFGPAFNESQGIYFNYKDIVPEKMMHLFIHESAPYFHSETISVICEGMNSYFSDGHKWAIRWRNNSVTSFERGFDRNTIILLVYDKCCVLIKISGKLWNSNLATIFEDDPKIHGVRFADVTLHWKMYELICYVPVYNTSEWVSRSVKLDVQKSTPPMIGGLPLEEVNFLYNDTEKLLECKSLANPAATIRWTKNGEDLPSKMIILNKAGTSILMFHRITHDTGGEYRCYAKNIGGETYKIIRVFVEDNSSTESSSAWGTTAAVLVPLLIIGFVITAGALVWKMQLQKKIVNHLSRVVFRDAERQNEYSA